MAIPWCHGKNMPKKEKSAKALKKRKSEKARFSGFL
jgi:hypothetical protein